jgi:AcrR family transcriptional regulator
MAKKNRKRGVSRAEWLEAALKQLEYGSVSNVTIEGLAQQLGIAKSGFYWHFRSRDDLLAQILDYWTHEITEVISENLVLQSLSPRDRLIQVAEVILAHGLTRYEMGIRQWAMTDRVAARAVRAVNRERLKFIGQAFEELGFSGDDAEVRTRLYVCYHTWEASMFPEVTKKRRKELIRKRIDQLTRK